MPMRIVLRLLVLVLCAGPARTAAAEVVALATDTTLDRVVTADGLILRATAPLTVRGTVRLGPPLGDGLVATVIAQSLRGVRADDWRIRPDVAGTRHDDRILVGSAAGTPAERARFAVGGSDRDWNGFSIQWDGRMEVPAGGVDLATASDDGSRVWLDRDGDDLVDADEWGENGWGSGQGTTTRLVHAAVPPGRYRLRVQYEEGSGGNACSLRWRSPGGDWTLVPASAFQVRSRLHVEGPLTLAADIAGPGLVVLGDGARLAAVPAVDSLRIAGRVAVAGDLDLSGTSLELLASATLALAGHAVVMDAARTTTVDAGAIALESGTLTLRGERLALAVQGPGTLLPTSATLHLAALDDQVAIAAPHYRVHAGDRVRARLAGGSPLTVTVPVAQARAGDHQLAVAVVVPPAAPALGLGAFRSDRHGRWFQTLHPGTLAPGRHEFIFTLGSADHLSAEGHGGVWHPGAAVELDRVGIFVYAGTGVPADIEVDARLVAATPPAAATTSALSDLALDGWDGVAAHGRTGQRWQLAVRPTPYPVDPFDPERFRLDLVITEPDGQQRTFAGFHDQPVDHHDRGDAEIFRESGAPRFRVRFRPRLPGRHQLGLVWAVDGAEQRRALGDLHVTGEPWDDIVRPDAGDPRFFSADGRFVWPLGHNLHSTYDVRAVPAVGSRLTIDRGSFVREPLLRRLAAAGGTGTETWLSAWNLGLEWNPAWRGYHGAGRYHAGHAWAVDRFLDLAEELGVRVNLTIFNHGMGRDGEGAEMEWPFHPWNRRNGGWLDRPSELFTDERAFAAQRRLFRYLVARYGDSPALLGWKLWAEVDLTHAPREAKAAWHDRASAFLAGSDPYRRAVTSHWCGDWNNADRAICAQPTIGYICIDAYHGEATAIADLIAESVADPLRPGRGLGSFAKPVWVTEFGGSAFGTAPARLRAEHVVAPWVGFVTGHGASPLLWWLEWIDQGDHYDVFHALARFSAGEDLRDPTAGVVVPRIADASGPAWSRAWRRGHRWLGYVLDAQWGLTGGDGRLWQDARLRLDEVADGAYTVEIWDSERGVVRETRTAHASAGRLVVDLPPFARSLAFKVWR